MFGYVRPVMDKLPPEEQERFEAVYCGLCAALGREYGLAARCTLNYDLTFLAILLSQQQSCDCHTFRCSCKGLRKKTCADATPALERAADISVILSYCKLKDEVADHDGAPGRIAASRLFALALRRAYRKAAKKQPQFAAAAAQHLARLRQLEAERCPSLDRPADAFAQILAAAGENWYSDPDRQKILRQMLYHLGRWIYLIDAADDLEKDAQSGSYNPLRYRFDLQDGKLDIQSRQRLIATLDHSVNLLSSAFALADYGAWTALLENLIYYALPQTGYLVLEGKWNAGQDGTPCTQRLRAAKQRERTEPTA